MTGREVRAMNDDELRLELSKTREKIYSMRVQTVTEKVADTSQFAKLRKDAARLLTEQTARQAKAAAAKG